MAPSVRCVLPMSPGISMMRKSILTQSREQDSHGDHGEDEPETTADQEQASAAPAAVEEQMAQDRLSGWSATERERSVADRPYSFRSYTTFPPITVSSTLILRTSL